MSETLLRIIPTDPAWMPDEQAEAGALAVLRDLTPDAREVTADRFVEVEFVDQGENFESVYCPTCGVELETDWWGATMNAAYRTRFTDLAVRMPCCGALASLNDLDYRWPAGFARFVLEARDPERGQLVADEQERIAAALGHAVRVIWAHI